jgi:hypothetical protein
MTTAVPDARAVRAAWLPYAGAALLATAAVAGAATVLVPPPAARGVWAAAAMAYVLQVIAFALLLVVRERAQLFLLGWLGGMLLRFAAVGAVAFWVTRTGALPAAATLVSLAGFLFLLLLLEPVFLRRGLRTT